MRASVIKGHVYHGPVATCADCEEPIEECICAAYDYDEDDEADQRFDCEREERD
jgi:hypothetical protein